MKMSLSNTTKTFLFLLVVTISSVLILSQSRGLGLKEKQEFKDSVLNNKEFLSAEFTHTEFPQSQLPTHIPFSKSILRLKYKSGITKEIPLDYKTLFHSGDSIGGGQAGLVKNTYGEPIVNFVDRHVRLRLRLLHSGLEKVSEPNCLRNIVAFIAVFPVDPHVFYPDPSTVICSIHKF